MAIGIEQIRVGSTVLVLSNFGTGPREFGRVDAVLEDVKNGRPGIDYKNSFGELRWAYLDQIVQVETY